MSGEVSFDQPPVFGEAEAEVLLSAENMGRLFANLKPHLAAGKRKLAYVFPATGRFAHMAMEPHALWALYGREFDEILMVINRRSILPVHEGLFRLASRYVRFVETDEPNVVMLGHYDGPTTDFGIFTFLMQRPETMERDYFKLLRDGGTVPYLTLPADMAADRDALYRRLGIGAGEPVVTVHLRERSYLPTHPYHYFRTASLENYRPAIDRLVAKGYWVFRLGDASSTPLDHPSPRVIDLPRLPGYANWMDVVLLASARFALCCQSGPDGVSRVFGTPTLLVNGYAVGMAPRNPGDLMLYKRYWDEADRRWLGYREVLARGIDLFDATGEFEAARVRLEENTAAEILEAVDEMEDRLDGRFADPGGVDGRYFAIGRACEAERFARWAAAPDPDPAKEPWYAHAMPGLGYSNAFCAAHPEFLD